MTSFPLHRRSLSLASSRSFQMDYHDSASAPPVPTLQAKNTAPTQSGVLFQHPFAKIVKFELPKAQAESLSRKASISSLSPPPLDNVDYEVDAAGTLPWRTIGERIVALGQMKIQHITGSTAFLLSGSVAKPLMSNSQGWCVDGRSTLVIRVGKLAYYRIELPGESEKDLERVEALKQVLSKLILYEVTPCPFQRGFSVPIPTEAKLPKKRKPWKPKANHETGRSRAISLSHCADDTNDMNKHATNNAGGGTNLAIADVDKRPNTSHCQMTLQKAKSFEVPPIPDLPLRKLSFPHLDISASGYPYGGHVSPSETGSIAGSSMRTDSPSSLEHSPCLPQLSFNHRLSGAFPVDQKPLDYGYSGLVNTVRGPVSQRELDSTAEHSAPEDAHADDVISSYMEGLALHEDVKNTSDTKSQSRGNTRQLEDKVLEVPAIETTAFTSTDRPSFQHTITPAENSEKKPMLLGSTRAGNRLSPEPTQTHLDATMPTEEEQQDQARGGGFSHRIFERALRPSFKAVSLAAQIAMRIATAEVDPKQFEKYRANRCSAIIDQDADFGIPAALRHSDN